MDMEEVLVAGLLVLLGGVAVVGMLAFWGLHRIRRDAGWRRALLQLRAMVTRRGVNREVAQLRVHLQRAIEGAHAAAAALRAAGRSSDVQVLMRRLSTIAFALDGELRLLAKEPDPAAQSRVLAQTRLRVREAVGVATMIRGTAATILWGDTDVELATLAKDAALEMAAAQAGARAGIRDDLPPDALRELRDGADAWMITDGQQARAFHIEMTAGLERVVRTVGSLVRAARTIGHERA